MSLAFVATVALGLLLLFLAALIARASPDRAARRPLAAYLALVGLNYLLDGTSFLVAGAGGNPNPWRYAALVPVFLDPPALLLFALVVTRGAVPAWRQFLYTLPGIAVLALYVASPPAAPYMVGWAFRHVYAVELGWYYAASFVFLLARYLTEERSLQRDRLATFVLAFGVVVLPRMPLLVVDVGFRQGPTAWIDPTIVFFLISGLAVLYAATVAAARAKATAGNRAHVDATLRNLLILLVVVAGLWSLLFVPPFRPAGAALVYPFRWFLFAAVMASGIRRFDLLGLPERYDRLVSRGLGAALLVLAAADVSAIIAALPESDLATSVGGGVAAAAVGFGLYVAVRRGVAGAPPELLWRRMTVYRAHVELGAPRHELERIRRELGLGEREAREVRSLVRMERAIPAATREATLVEGARFLDRYLVQGFLGVGTFGRTFAAWDSLRGERVVLKELLLEWREDREAVERFRREAETALAVAHPNLVAFRGLERIAGGHVLVLSFVEGTTLRARYAAGALVPTDAVRLGVGVLSGLSAVHAVGIVHRDVKPENIMVRPDGTAVLLDFGSVTGRSTGTKLAGTRGHPGTPAYMSPEQRDGSTIGPQSDIYAVATVLWEAVAAVLPPRGNVPEPLRSVLVRGLAPEPAKRWESATAFRAALEDVKP